MLEGNPGGRPLNENEPQLPSTRSIAQQMRPSPEDISFKALKEYDRIVELLLDSEVITDADIMTLVVYIETYDRYLQAQKLLKKGLLIKNHKGHIINNPAFGMTKHLVDQMSKLQSELGITPSSRSKITVVNKKPKWKNETEARLFGRKK